MLIVVVAATYIIVLKVNKDEQIFDFKLTRFSEKKKRSKFA